MATGTAKELFSLLGKSRLLTPEQLAQSRELAKDRGDDVSAIVADLVRQDFLSRWQGSQLLAGRWSFFLGKYKLIDLLGRGGMGSVFLGEHVTMNRRVALKVLSKQIGKEPGSLERFLDEARMIASLDHPNIVHAFSVDCEGDRYYIVMEYIDGADLQRIVDKEGPMDFARAVDCIRQTADGLTHAHANKVVHCDIKPSNLLLTEQGTIKILDMGLARLVGRDDAAQKQDDSVLGSVDYLAPEQAIASPSFDHRADIYSLGCTLYFLLTGKPPFPEGTLAQRIVKHQTQSPRAITDLRENAPAGLVEICGRMMAKEPAERYQTAEEVSQTLAAWRPSAQPAPKEKRLPVRKKAEEPAAEAHAAKREDMDLADAFAMADAARVNAKVAAKKDAAADVQQSGGRKAVGKAGRAGAVSAGVAAGRGAKPGLLSTSKGKLLVGGAVGGGALIAAAAAVAFFVMSPGSTTATQKQSAQSTEKPKVSTTDAIGDLGAIVLANRTEADKSGTDKTGADKPVVVKPDTQAPSPERAGTAKPDVKMPGGESPDNWQPTVGPPAIDTKDGSKEPAGNAVAKPGSDKPDPVPSEPPQALPQTDTPKQDPPANTAPFSELVKTVDLPKLAKEKDADAEGPVGEAVSLGMVHLAAGTLPEIKLLGGETAMKGANHFEIDAPTTNGTKSVWNLHVDAKESSAGKTSQTDIATVSLDGETLQFRWLAGAAKAPKVAGHLRNCGLKFSSGSATHWLALCNPIQVEPLALDLKAGIDRTTIPLEFVPEASSLRVEILRLDGPSPKSMFRPSNTLRMPAKGEKDPTNLIAATLDVPEAKGFTVDLQIGFDARGAKPILAISACAVTASGSMLLSGKALIAQANTLQAGINQCEAVTKASFNVPPNISEPQKRLVEQQKQVFEQQKKQAEERKKILDAQLESLKPLVAIGQKLHKNVKVPYKVYIALDEEKIELASSNSVATVPEGSSSVFDTPTTTGPTKKKKN